MIVLCLRAQLAVLYTYNCLLLLIYYMVRPESTYDKQMFGTLGTRYSLWPIKLVKDKRTSSL